MGKGLLHQVLGEAEQAGLAEYQRQDHLLRNPLLAEKEVVKVFLPQAEAQMSQAVTQQQQEIPSEIPEVRERGQEEDAPGTGAGIPLQPLKKTMVKQVVPL